MSLIVVVDVLRADDAPSMTSSSYLVPLAVVDPFAVDLEGSAVATATGEDQVPAAQVGTGHVRLVEVSGEENESGPRFSPEFNVKCSPKQRRQ